MEIVDFNTLLTSVRTSSEEEAAKLIKTYGDCRAKSAIEEAWRISRIVMKSAMCGRNKRIKNEILEFEEDQSVISLVSFTRYIAAVEALIKEHNERSSEETKMVLSDISDFMLNKVGSIPLDRRIIYTKD